MKDITIIIFTLITFAKFVHGFHFKESDLQKLTKEHLNINKFLVKVNSIFIDVCNKMFNMDDNLAQKLGQMKPQDASDYFRHTKFTFTTQSDLILSLVDLVRDYSDSILKGRFQDSEETISNSIEDYVHYSIALDPKKHDRSGLIQLFEILTTELQKNLQEDVFQGLETGEFKPILENVSELETEYQKELLITKLKEHNISLAFSATLIRLVLSTSSYSDFNPAISGSYLEDIKLAFSKIEDYLKNCSENYFRAQVLPYFQFIHALKYKTEWSDRNLFMNRVTVYVIQKFNDTQVSKIIQYLLGQSFEETSQAIQSHEYFEFYKNYIKTKHESGRVETDNHEEAYLLYDYMVCFPDEIVKKKFSEKEIEDVTKQSSNINNYSFFLDFFKYYGKDQIPVFDILYEVLAYLRNVNQDSEINKRTWSDYMTKYFYRDYAYAYIFDKDRNSEQVPNPKAEFINIVYILSKIVIDNKIHYYYMMFNQHDPVYKNGFRDYKWHDIFSHNDNYVVDYIRMRNASKPEERLPRLKYGTITNLVIPSSGSLTDQDKKLLRHPKFMWEIHRRLEEGQKVMPITDIDPNYVLNENEEVIIVVLDRVPKTCKKTKLRQLFNI